MKLSVVIPARNEAGNIGRTLDHLRARLGREGIQCEIILVDDGSTDGTRLGGARPLRRRSCDHARAE